MAIKLLPRGTKITKYVKNEIVNQKPLRHPHVTALLDVFLLDAYLCLVLEYASGKGHSDHMGVDS